MPEKVKSLSNHLQFDLQGYDDSAQEDEYAQDSQQHEPPGQVAEQPATLEPEASTDATVQHHAAAEGTRQSQHSQENGFTSSYPQTNPRQQPRKQFTTAGGPGRGRRGGRNGAVEGQQRFAMSAGVGAGQHVWIPPPPIRRDMQAGFAGEPSFMGMCNRLLSCCMWLPLSCRS